MVAAGEVLDGKYRIDRILGRGGMGYVVAAWHLRLDEPVALKFLRQDMLGHPEVATRFEREAQAAAKVKGEHVCRVLDVGHSKKHGPFMVMEFLEGEDLGSLVDRGGPLTVAEALHFVLQACEALAEAHDRGIVHRDLKPANLFLSKRPNGEPLVKLLDFGISKSQHSTGKEHRLTVTDTVMGSFAYMSPEHVRSARDVDRRTDVWALGVILFELLTGTLPFPALSQSELIAKISADPPLRLRALKPSAPEGLESAILKCLQKDRDRRFSSVAELALSLAPFAPDDCRALVESILRISGETVPVRAKALSAPELTPFEEMSTAADSDKVVTGPRQAPSPTLPSAGAAEAPRAGARAALPQLRRLQPSSESEIPTRARRRAELGHPAEGPGNAAASPPGVPDLSVGAAQLPARLAAAASSGIDASTVAPWTPGRLRAMDVGNRKRLLGVMAVAAALGALIVALVIVAQPAPEPTPAALAGSGESGSSAGASTPSANARAAGPSDPGCAQPPGPGVRARATHGR